MSSTFPYIGSSAPYGSGRRAWTRFAPGRSQRLHVLHHDSVCTPTVKTASYRHWHRRIVSTSWLSCQGATPAWMGDLVPAATISGSHVLPLPWLCQLSHSTDLGHGGRGTSHTPAGSGRSCPTVVRCPEAPPMPTCQWHCGNTSACLWEGSLDAS